MGGEGGGGGRGRLTERERDNKKINKSFLISSEQRTTAIIAGEKSVKGNKWQRVILMQRKEHRSRNKSVWQSCVCVNSK